ncbi:MAG: sugar kinase [Clostridiales bacterium]|jgi:2-dehydro-3-deoxygluconokinase|nr:sugar kinase [Clostridiales bacterium]
MKKILTFGEIMMRLQPPEYKRFSDAKDFELYFGGAEANAAVSLAGFGTDAVFFTKLPENALADACVRDLKSRGVNVDFILRGGDRMGIYFCEKGVSQRPSRIIYDRKGASINTLFEGDIDVARLLDGVEWFHFSGITPALSDTVLFTLKKILFEAKKRGITVSCDLNFRKNLWSVERARAVMTELVSLSDVLISNEEECKSVFGLEAEGADITGGTLDAGGYARLAGTLCDIFKNLKIVAFTLRGSRSADVNDWSGILVADGKCYRSKEYTIRVVDRIGGGDSFSAGLIYSVLYRKDFQYAVDFAVAASCLKHSVAGDFNSATVSEVEELMSGDGSGRIKR